MNHFGAQHHVVQSIPTLFAPWHQTGQIRIKEKPMPGFTVQTGDDVIRNQMMHVISILQEAQALNSDYVLLLEDDFPICAYKWHVLMQKMCTIQQHQVNNCGLFTATGGSGFVIPTRTALPVLLQFLQSKQDAWPLEPHDILMQVCLAGIAPACQATCNMRYYTTPTLLFYHTGWKSSTIPDREFPMDRWQCGWRNPMTEQAHVQIV